MKCLFSVSLICFHASILLAQASDVITKITEPTAIAKVGDMIFYGEFAGDLRSFDLTDIEAGTTALTTTNGIYRSTLLGDELYFTEPLDSRISKINVSEIDPEPTTVLTSAVFPLGMTSDDDFVYFSDRAAPGIAIIVRFPADDPADQTVIFVTEQDPVSICKLGDYMYFVDLASGSVGRFDVTVFPVEVDTIAAGLDLPTDLIGRGETLLVSDFDAGSVVSIDLTTAAFEKTDLLTQIDGPTGLFLDGNELYIGVFFAGKIIKYVFPTLSSEAESRPTVTVFPNPTDDYIYVSDLSQGGQYVVVDASGKAILTGTVAEGRGIDVRSVSTGTYYISVEGSTVARFVKQ